MSFQPIGSDEFARKLFRQMGINPVGWKKASIVAEVGNPVLIHLEGFLENEIGNDALSHLGNGPADYLVDDDGNAVVTPLIVKETKEMPQ